MKDEQQILEDSSLKLAVELDNTSDSADNMSSSFDITTDSSLNLSIEQDKLSKEIAKRKKLEEKLNQHQKLIDFTNLPKSANDESSTPTKNETKENDVSSPDGPKTANELIKEQLGTLKEFKSKYIASAKDEQKFRKEQRKSIFSNYKKSESLTVRTAGAMMHNVNSQFSDIVGGLLNQLPGFGVAKNATKFVVDNYKETRQLKKDKKLGESAERAYSTRSETIKSNFERVSNDSSSIDSKKETETRIKQESENKKRTDLQKSDSNKNESRFSKLFKFLDNLKQMMLFKSLIGVFGSLASTLTSALSSGFSFLATGLGLKLAGVIAGITGLKSVFSNGLGSLKSLFPNSNKVPTDVRTNKPTTVDTKTKPSPSKPLPDVDSKTDIKSTKPNTPATKKSGWMSKAGNTMSKVFKRVPKIGLGKKIVGGAAKRLLPALIGGPLGMALSFGLLASDLVDVGKFAYGQFSGTSDKDEPSMIMDGDVKSEPKIIIDGADTSQLISGDMLEQENQIVEIEKEKRRLEERESIELRARQAMVANNIDSRTNVTNITQSGYAMNYNKPIDNKVF